MFNSVSIHSKLQSKQTEIETKLKAGGSNFQFRLSESNSSTIKHRYTESNPINDATTSTKVPNSMEISSSAPLIDTPNSYVKANQAEGSVDKKSKTEVEKGAVPETKVYRTPSINAFEQNIPLSARSEIGTLIEEMATKYNVPSSLISKVIQAESNFNPKAVSKVGAQGLMQLMPETAKWLGVKDPFNPRDNIEGGVKYLSQMLTRYKDVSLALAAYNAGPGNVDKYGGIPPFKETQTYVKKILN